MLNRRILGGFIVVAMVVAAALPAAAVDIPLRNWPAPPTWTPPASSGSGRTALALSQGYPLPFIPVTPCRVVDTRGLGQIAPFGTPTIPAGGTRAFPLPTHTVCTGIPSTAGAYSLNVAVTNTGSGAGGYLQLWPTGTAQPTSANLNYPGAGSTLSNAVIVQAGTSGSINVFSGNASADVIIDINGYYAYDISNAGVPSFGIITSTGPYAIFGLNSATNGLGVVGVAPTGTSAVGVYGSSNDGFGVRGTSTSNVGVRGSSGSLNGVWAESTSGDALYASGGRDGANIQGARHGLQAFSTAPSGVVWGVYAGIPTTAAAGSAGVHGLGAATTGLSYGVRGENFSTAYNSAGVRGVDMTAANIGSTTYINSGVRGESALNIGVHGVSNNIAIAGMRHNGSAVVTAEGLVGYSTYAFFGSIGDYGGVGAKYFVEPYPLDASKVIRYISLEGPESGTYFRGQTQTGGGQAVIQVPEHFRMVSDTEGITVHLTPVGHFAQIWVESSDLNEIVIRSSRDVTFNYIVHGVRRAFKDFKPVTQGEEFMPRTAQATLMSGLPAEIRERLIAMGIYNPDGTVNMATAERMGWAQRWRDDEAKAKAAQEAAAARAK